VADAGLDRRAQLILRFGVSVEVDPPRFKACAQRERELSARRDVARQALLF
jgi:hypothetical protein